MNNDFNIDIGGGEGGGGGIELEGRRMFRIVLSPAGFPNFCHNFLSGIVGFYGNCSDRSVTPLS